MGYAMKFVEMVLLLDKKNVMIWMISNKMAVIIVDSNVSNNALYALKVYVYFVNMDGNNTITNADLFVGMDKELNYMNNVMMVTLIILMVVIPIVI